MNAYGEKSRRGRQKQGTGTRALRPCGLARVKNDVPVQDACQENILRYIYTLCMK